jgi:hypothetical protein
MAQKPDADKTWPNFKAHFLKAQEERNEEPTTANQAGYNAALKPPWQPPLKL